MPEERSNTGDAPPAGHGGGGEVLADGDARYRLLFERSADAILLLDTHTNQFVEYNQAALDMLRCTREELRALHPSLLSPRLQEDGRESFEKANEMIAAAVRLGSNRFEWIHRSPHREDFPVEVVLTPIQMGDTPLVQVVWRDITERRRDEESMRQAQKLESLGVLASGIAHDFNNLLTAVRGHVALAGAELPVDHRAAEHLVLAERAVNKAADLTRQLLAYGGHGTFQVQPMDLNRSVREMTELLAVSVSKRVRMTCRLAEGLPAFLGDRAQVQQVVMNLVTNASEAIGDADGTIDLRTGVVNVDDEALRRELSGQALPPGRYLTLEVRDSGCGMSEGVLSRIFDPFFSTKQAGRGLGLSALRGILKAHRGGIGVRSEPGAGTTVTVYLPAASEPAEAASPKDPPPRPARARGMMLLVDDEALVRRSCKALLERLGFLVLEAGDGQTALGTYRSNRDRVSGVLMDLTMPVMDGHAAFLEMRRIDPGVRVILSSGWAENVLVDRFREAPPSAFLLKPFGTREVEAALRQAGIMEE